MDGKFACSAKGTAGDDAVVGNFSFIGDIFSGNGAVNFGADTLCLNGVDTDDADDEADGLPWPDGRYEGTCSPDVEPPDPFVVAETDPDREARGGLECAVTSLELVCGWWSPDCGRVVEWWK
jgi:hypothetical protein